MSPLNLNAKDIIRNVRKKLNLQNYETGGREGKGDYYLDGKFQFTVTLPNEHGARSGLSTGWLKVLRDSVFLTAQEYADLVNCPMDGERYERLIRERRPAQKKS